MMSEIKYESYAINKGKEVFENLLINSRVLNNMVTIEGADMTGGTTVSKRVVSDYTGGYKTTKFVKVGWSCEPKKPKTRLLVRSLLSSHKTITEITPMLINVFIKDRLAHQQQIAKYPLRLVVSDRSSLSTIIYQGLLHDSEEDINDFANEVVNRHIKFNVLVPKIIFVLGWVETKFNNMDDTTSKNYIELASRLSNRTSTKDVKLDRFDKINPSIELNRLYKGVTKLKSENTYKEIVIANRFREDIHIIQLNALLNPMRLSSTIRYNIDRIMNNQ